MVRWAVAGSGSMASHFLRDSDWVESGTFVAVYSHSAERAAAFAAEHRLAAAYSDYQQMLHDPEVDAVYIASTHEKHFAQALQALNAGKHVLVEKPMTLTRADTEALYAAAQAKGLYCAEALWTKFNPAFGAVMTQIAAGRLGELRHLQASFGFTVDLADTRQRLLNPEYAGGALLDIGIYPIMLALSVFGLPQSTQAQIRFGATGVDIAGDLLLSYADTRAAMLSYRFDAQQTTKATIAGSAGWVEFDEPWFASRRVHWKIGNEAIETETFDFNGVGWSQEFAAVNEDILAGRLTSSRHTPEQSLQLSGYMQQLRDDYGPRYPFE